MKKKNYAMGGFGMVTKTVLVSKEMSVGEIITQHPQAIEALQNFGVPCVGCSTDYGASLEEMAKNNGLTEEKIGQLVKTINQRIKEDPLPNQTGKNASVVFLSKKAAEKIKELMQKQGGKIAGLRFGAVPGGCSGFSYSLTFEEQQGKEDVVAESQGIKFFIHESHLNLLRGTQIDFVDALQGSGFKIVNPNAKSMCGCGQSFS
jgi:iron-sulfur cluster assembly accessory protein